ncbi:MAG: hypothetical protein LBR41_03690, partial [Rickettsiales bacterium]|nr:hypothetical protein [Rickettsiales bacterium]
MRYKPLCIVCRAGRLFCAIGVAFCVCIFSSAHADDAQILATKSYVDKIIAAGGATDAWTKSESDARYVPITQRGAASGVTTLDASVRVPFPQLPTGTAANTVATGDDARFWSVPVGGPGGNAAPGWATIYV